MLRWCQSAFPFIVYVRFSRHGGVQFRPPFSPQTFCPMGALQGGEVISGLRKNNEYEYDDEGDLFGETFPLRSARFDPSCDLQ